MVRSIETDRTIADEAFAIVRGLSVGHLAATAALGDV